MNYEVLFLIAFLKTIVIETVGLLLIFQFFWKKQKKKCGVWRIVSAGLIASGLTLPYLWFVLPAFLSGGAFAIVGETTITLIEFLVLKRLLPITYKQALIASITLNLLSFLTGRFIF